MIGLAPMFKNLEGWDDSTAQLSFQPLWSVHEVITVQSASNYVTCYEVILYCILCRYWKWKDSHVLQRLQTGWRPHSWQFFGRNLWSPLLWAVRSLERNRVVLMPVSTSFLLVYKPFVTDRVKICEMYGRLIRSWVSPSKISVAVCKSKTAWQLC